MAIIKRTNSEKNVGKEKNSRRWERKLCSHQGIDVEASKKQLIQVHTNFLEEIKFTCEKLQATKLNNLNFMFFSKLNNLNFMFFSRIELQF